MWVQNKGVPGKAKVTLVIGINFPKFIPWYLVMEIIDWNSGLSTEKVDKKECLWVHSQKGDCKDKKVYACRDAMASLEFH